MYDLNRSYEIILPLSKAKVKVRYVSTLALVKLGILPHAVVKKFLGQTEEKKIEDFSAEELQELVNINWAIVKHALVDPAPSDEVLINMNNFDITHIAEITTGKFDLAKLEQLYKDAVEDLDMKEAGREEGITSFPETERKDDTQTGDGLPSATQPIIEHLPG